jgi:hypothetical protein
MKKIILILVAVGALILLAPNSKVAKGDLNCEVIDVVAIVEIGSTTNTDLTVAEAGNEEVFKKKKTALIAQQANLVNHYQATWRGMKTTKIPTLANNDNGRALIAADYTNIQGGQLPNKAVILANVVADIDLDLLYCANDGSTVLKLLTKRNITAA